MVIFASVSFGCPQIYVLAFYIGPVVFCHIYKIYSNHHPVDILLPAHMTLHITPISDVILQFLFQNNEIPAPIIGRIIGDGLTPVFPLLSLATFRLIFLFHFVFRPSVFKGIEPFRELLFVLPLRFNGIERRPIQKMGCKRSSIAVTRQLPFFSAGKYVESLEPGCFDCGFFIKFISP